MKLRTGKILAGALLLWAASPVLAAERIPLYSYYNDAPLAAGHPDSLTDQLAAWLTARANGRYEFIPTQLPRRRLVLMLKQPRWPGVVAWANPRWFGEVAHPHQSWSKPYMIDANMVVSLQSKPLDYLDDSSLAGQRVGSVQGFNYVDIDRMIASGAVLRDDADSELRNLMKLKQQRVRVAFLQAISLPYFRKQYPDLDQWLHVSAKPRTVFLRHFFSAPGQPDLAAFLNQQVDALIADHQWQTRLGTCKLVPPSQSDAHRKLCR
jgi:polar amino acid transport system substrate-binding protein